MSVELSDNLFELIIPLLLIVAGNYLSKLRSNWFLGIRTPWTLSSEVAWKKTHRVGGRVLILLGVALIPPVFFLDTVANFWVAGAAILGVAVILIVYSYFAWRSDPAVRS